MKMALLTDTHFGARNDNLNFNDYTSLSATTIPITKIPTKLILWKNWLVKIDLKYTLAQKL